MSYRVHELSFDGALLERGFWLYVWEIEDRRAKKLYYVGRTGDSSSTNAQSPLNRMSAHLGTNEKSNALRRNLELKKVELEKCSFRLVAVGPVWPESKTKARADHDVPRDKVAAMEKALAGWMAALGCEVINEVRSKKGLGRKTFKKVQSAFCEAFPEWKIEEP